MERLEKAKQLERLEKVRQLGWFDFLILKALISEPNKSLSTKQMALKLKSYFDYYGVGYSSESRRIYFLRKTEILKSLGLITKIKGSVNIYCLNEVYANEVMMLTAGYFGILDKKERD